MAMRKILVDETNRELCEHGTVGFPMTCLLYTSPSPRDTR